MKKINVKLVIIVSLILFSLDAICIDITWTGGAGDNDWNAPGNWNPAQVPEADDNVIFNNPPVGPNQVNILTGVAECNNIFFNGQDYTLNIAAGTKLEVQTDLILIPLNTISNNGEISIGHNLECGGFFDNYNAGKIEVTDKTTVGPGGQLDNRGAGANAGEITINDLVNDGAINIMDNAELKINNDLDNIGTIINMNNAEIVIINNLDNQGAINNVNDAELKIFNDLNNLVTINNMNDAKLVVSNNLINQGTINNQDMAVVDGDNTLTITNDGTINNIDQAVFLDVLNLTNNFEINNNDIAEIWVLNVLQNFLDINNESGIDVGDTYFNNLGATTLNSGQISIGNDLVCGGFIDNSGTITIQNDLSNNAGGLINNTGCLIVYGNIYNDGEIIGSILNYGTISGSGTYSFNRETGGTGTREDPDGWHYISSPVNGMSCYDIFDYWINDWNETQNTWYNYSVGSTPCIAGPDNPLNTIKGYGVKLDLNYQCNSVNPGTGTTIEFTGTSVDVHTGPYSISVIGSDFEPGDPNQLNNWNLVGNPYPSAIVASLITFPAEIDNAVYYYDDAALTYDSYVGGVGQPFIPVAQGFIIHINTNGSWLFSLDNSVRTCAGSDIWYKNSVNDLLKLEASGNNYKDETYIRFLEDATPGFDKFWDAYKLLSESPFVPQIYTTMGTTKLSINTQPSTKMAPLAFTVGSSGSYSITATVLSDFKKVYLEDKKTGMLHNLCINPTYHFSYEKGEDANRFVVHFSEISKETEDHDMVIYSNQNNVFVYNINNQQGDVYIYNVVGQLLGSISLQDGINNITLDNANGYYIVNVRTSNTVVNKKVFIK